MTAGTLPLYRYRHERTEQQERESTLRESSAQQRRGGRDTGRSEREVGAAAAAAAADPQVQAAPELSGANGARVRATVTAVCDEEGNSFQPVDAAATPGVEVPHAKGGWWGWGGHWGPQWLRKP